MSAEQPVKLRPWRPPNYASAEPSPRQQQTTLTPSFHVNELTQDALDAQVSRWLHDLYTLAGKPNPWACSDLR